MAGPKEFQKWLIVNTSTVKSLVWGGGSTAQDTVDFLNDAISSSGWTSGPLYYKDDNGECYINTGDQQPTNPGIIGITTGNASTSNICVTRNDQDWYGWRIIEEGDPCDVSVQTQSFTTETSGATVNDQREGSYDHWVAMGSPSPNDILQYTSTINGVTAQRCWIFEYTGSVLPNGGATFTEPLPGQFPPNLGDATTNCDVCATNLFEDIQYHVWEVCGSGFSEPLLNTSIFNNIPAGGYPTNNDDVEALMALPHGGTLVIGDVSQYDGVCYEYRGLDSISNGQYQTWSGLPDLGLTAATAHGDCNNCMNPSTTDDYWHNWKRHSTCGTNPVETSITNAASNASLSAKRQGSHDFWVAMGEPNVGQFITYGPPGSDPQCWEYMGYDPSGNMAPGSMVDYIQEPTPALTGADQFNDCTTCYIDLTGGQLYHLFSNCDNPSDTFIGLTSSTTVDVAENNALYTAFSNPSPGQYFQWENSFQELKCIKYEGQGTAGQATSLPVAMNHITGPVNVGTFFNECNACLTPPGNYHKWMKCGSTEVVNIVSVGSNNDPTENGNFWASVGNPLQNKIVDFDSGAGRSDDCYEYLGTSASAESGLEFKNIGTAQIYNDCATCSVIPVPGCMDPLASNYNPAATVDDGSCTFAAGCTDPAADNYDPSANLNDGSCQYSTTCNDAPITGLFMTNIIDDRATFNFDNMNTYDANGNQICRVDQLRMQYRPVGTSAWSQKNIASPVGYDATTGICNSTQKTDKNVYGLILDTEYEWRAKVWYCSGGNGGWVDGPNFTTALECPNGDNFAVYGSTPTRATFTWDDSNGSYEFLRIKMRVDSISNPTSSDWFLVGGTGVPYGTYTKNKNGLVPGETYRGQGRTWCNPNGGAYNSLSWSSFGTWTQPTNRIEGGYSIKNLDIYPNPSKDIFNISFTSEDIQDLRVRVMNIIGEELIVEDLQQFVGEYTKQYEQMFIGF